MRLAGKVAIVTGAGAPAEGTNVGGAIAIRFAREGARVAVLDLAEERAERTVGIVGTEGGEALAVLADVTDETACERAVATVEERWGRVDVLVNSVGIFPRSSRLDELDPAVWDAVMAVNVRGPALMARAVIPRMRDGGSIVSIASISGLRASGVTAYGPSKAALAALDRDLAVVHGPEGIRANTIAPGHLFTPLVAGSLTPEARERRRRIAPLQIEGDAWDVAAAAVFLASDEARFVTGACLTVDGGVTAIAALTAAALLD